MADVRLVQNDTRPTLSATLRRHSDDEPIDLTAADSVRFQMRKQDDRAYTVDAEAEIDVAADGTVHYDWAPNDLAVPGLYDCQWEIHWDDDTVLTTDPPNTIEVRRQ